MAFDETVSGDLNAGDEFCSCTSEEVEGRARAVLAGAAFPLAWSILESSFQLSLSSLQ